MGACRAFGNAEDSRASAYLQGMMGSIGVLGAFSLGANILFDTASDQPMITLIAYTHK